MRNPSFLGVTLITLSSVALLLPPAFLCFQFLGTTLPSSWALMLRSTHGTATIKTWVKSFMEQRSPFYCDIDAEGFSLYGVTYIIMARILLRIADTLSLAMSRTPQFIASGLLFYIAICVGYAGFVHLNSLERRRKIP